MWMYIVATIIVLFTTFYFKVKYNMTYWKRMGVTEEKGYFPLGSAGTWNVISRKIARSEVFDQEYRNHTGEKVVGSYGVFGKPQLVVRDLDLAKRILVKDFDHFTDRRPESDNVGNPDSENTRYISKMLFIMQGDEWKHMRSTLSPVFTSGKLKNMVPLIHKVADECNEHMANLCGQNIDAKAMMRDFSLDVIISTAFGIESNTFKEPDNIFSEQSRRMVNEKVSWRFHLGLLLALISPKLLKWLDLPLFFDKETSNFFAQLIRSSMAERKKEGIRRNDLIDLVIDSMEKETNFMEELKEAEDVQQYDKDAVLQNVNKERHRWTDDELELVLISNALLTFIVAFDQVSSASSKLLYHLAKNPEIQEKLHLEISTELKKTATASERLDYASVMKLPYLDMAVHETIRHYPITPLQRVATKAYQIPDTNLTIPKGMSVLFPYTAIMKDEQHFPDPERYNPENFSEEAKSKRHPYAYSGFGHGPRNCIAMRFAILQVKLIISRIVTAYKILPCEKTVDKLIRDPKSRTIQPKGGVWISVEKRD